MKMKVTLRYTVMIDPPPSVVDKRRLEAERDAALKQAEAVSREYDRMLEEHAKLQEQMKKASGAEESKKDD